jgi:hypothetical protein
VFPGYVAVIRCNRDSLERSLNCPFSDVFWLALKEVFGCCQVMLVGERNGLEI